MKISAWKSEETGEIFEFEKDYRSHMRFQNRLKREQEAIDKKIQECKDWLAAEKAKIHDVSEIIPWIMREQKTLMYWTNEMKMHSFNDKFYLDSDVITKLMIGDARYDGNLSNGHCCPEGGVQNWCNQDKTLPSGYPGYKFELRDTLSRKRDKSNYPTSGLFKLIRIHCFAGGGGNEDWLTYGNLFLTDWPGISETVMFNEIKGVK